jgi:hypothetical protein
MVAAEAVGAGTLPGIGDVVVAVAAAASRYPVECSARVDTSKAEATGATLRQGRLSGPPGIRVRMLLVVGPRLGRLDRASLSSPMSWGEGRRGYDPPE